MSIYFINIGLILFNAFFLKLFNKKRDIKIVFLSFIHMFLLVALRAPTVGVDVQGYINLFHRTKQYSLFDFTYSRHEVGYLALNKMSQFIKNEQIFIAILAFIPLVLIFKFILKESSMPWLSIYLFVTLGFYTNTFNLLRQIIAMAIIVNSYKYLYKNNLKKFILTVTLASLFHITALSFIIVYIFRNKKLNNRNIIFYICSGVFVFLFAKQILIRVLKFINFDYEIKSGGGYTLLLVLTLVLIVSLIFRKNILRNNSNNIIMYNIVFLAIIVQIFALEFALFTRVTSYFSIFLIVFIPEILIGIKDSFTRMIGCIIVVILTALQYYLALNIDLSSIVPYEFFF